jgi:hypothetical protein
MYIIGNECRFSVRFLWHVHQYDIVLTIYDKDSLSRILMNEYTNG